MKKIYFLLMMVFMMNGAWAQVLLQWNTFGNSGTETTEPSVFNNANLSGVTNLTIGAGVTPAANANRFGGNNWFNTGNTNPNTLTEAVAGNDFIQFIVTPNAGFSFSPTSFVFSWDHSATGPASVTLRSSVDGFTANLGSVTGMPASISSGNTITISGLSNIATPTTFRLYGYAATATTGTGGFDVASDIVNVQLNGTTASTTTPDIALSSPNPAIAAGNVQQGSLNHPIYRFDLAVTTANATLNGVTVTTAGTYLAGGVTNFKCWYSTDNIFSAATDLLLSTKTTGLGAGAQVFPAFNNQIINSGSTGYIFITADVACAATVGNNISVNAITTGDISFVSGNKTGSAFAGGQQTFTAATPNNVTTPAASVANASSNLTWANPAGCYDEIMIIASQGAANTGGAPAGDGTAYTPASLAYGAGFAYGNGFVVYKGLTSGQTVTGLTNGTPYFYKFFTRLGTTWSAGIEINQTPNVVTLSTDFFRSKNTGDWDLTTTWESSSDNVSWMDATITPDENSSGITIRNGHIVTNLLSVTADQLVVQPTGTLILATAGTFTLANGPGTDMIVDGTVINTLGANTIDGTIAFNAGSLYQHNRDGGIILPASWNVNSTAEITGIVIATGMTGANQSFGNFTWNNIAQTTNLNLTGGLTTVNGNFRVQNSGIGSLRLTASASLNLIVGGNFTVEDDLNIDNNATGTTNISIGGNFVHSAGVFESSASLVTITMTGASNTFNQSGGTFTNSNLNWVINAGAEITMLSDLPLATSRSLTVNGILNAGLRSVNGTGAITVTNGGRVRVGSLSVSGAVNDNLSATGGLTLNTGSTIEFNGLSGQFVAARTFSNLQINNANGVTAIGAVTVNDVLGLTSGIIYTTATNMLNMAASSSYTGGTTNSSYVYGPMKKIGNTEFVFPVGKTAASVPGGIAQIGMSNIIGGSVTDEFVAEYIKGNARNLGPVSAIGLDHVSACDYWNLNRTNGSATIDITCYWSNNNTCNTPYIDNLAELVIAHFNGTSWDAFGTVSTATGTTTTGTVVWTGVSTFSPFSLGSISFNNPLPITLNYFNGTKQNGKHLLNWKVTCNSVPSVNIDVERSVDGINFISISNIFASALRCEQPFDYIDASPLKGINYYRLKMTDSDGKISFSSRVALTNNSKGMDVMPIAPNPIVGGKFNVRINTATGTRAELLISDMQGRILQKQTANIIAGFNNVPVNVRQLSAGTYQLMLITADGDRKLLRFVVQ